MVKLCSKGGSLFWLYKFMETLKFPKNFLWGAATSAHQAEGNNHNDWSEWEKKNAERLAKEAGEKWEKWQQKKFPEMFNPENYISGRACDHYNRYEEDFDIAKELGHNAHRFSIEWSRIEPEEGKFDEKEIEHYRKVILALRKRGMEPFVTLWHFTSPVWIRDMGGWSNRKVADYFVRYVEKIVSSLGENVNFWITLNEPNIYSGLGYFRAVQPPGKRNIIKGIKAYLNLVRAHKKAYEKIHDIDHNAQVGFTNSVIYFPDKFLFWAEYFWNHLFIKLTQSSLDFIGCNYFTKADFHFNTRRMKIKNPTDLGWEIIPEGIYHIVMSCKKYNLPIYITENGLADAEDKKRTAFIRDHLFWLCRTIQDGANVKGYFHWSFLEVFEHVELRGFWPRFGLVEIDYKTMERKIRKSAWEYAKICRRNEIETK